MERLSIAILGILLLASPTEAQQPKSYPIPKQAKFIELDGQKIPVPERATGMRVETQFAQPRDERVPGAKYRALPARATTFGGQAVPPGATHYRYVLKFRLPKQRGMSDVLNGDDVNGTYEVDGVVPTPPGTKPPAAKPPAARPPAAEPPKPPSHDPPPAATPPATQPPASPPARQPPPTQPKPPTIRQVLVQIDY